MYICICFCIMYLFVLKVFLKWFPPSVFSCGTFYVFNKLTRVIRACMLCFVYKAINWLCQICVSVLDIITIISRALFNYFFKIKIALATRQGQASLSSQAAVGHCHRQQQSGNIVVMAGTSTEWRHSLGAVRWSQGPRAPAWLQLTRPSCTPRGTFHPGR